MNTNAQVDVRATVSPLQLISAAITDGVSQTGLILEGEQGHHPVLKPSQRMALDEAEILLWLGPNFESTLVKVIKDLETKLITAIELEGINRLPLRNGIDPHLWLDTDNAFTIAKALTEELSQLDNANQEKFEKNLIVFEAALNELKQKIQAKLDAQSNKAFAVYHNAFQYYEQQFGLQHTVSFTEDEELQPGVRQLLSIRKTLEDNDVNCLLVEPSTNTANLSNVLDNEQLRYVSIDVLGTNIQVDKHGYEKLMLSLTDAVIECLR